MMQTPPKLGGRSSSGGSNGEPRVLPHRTKTMSNASSASSGSSSSSVVNIKCPELLVRGDALQYKVPLEKLYKKVRPSRVVRTTASSRTHLCLSLYLCGARASASSRAGARTLSRSTRTRCSTTSASMSSRAASCRSQARVSWRSIGYSNTAIAAQSPWQKSAVRAGKSRRALGVCCSSAPRRATTDRSGSIA